MKFIINLCGLAAAGIGGLTACGSSAAAKQTGFDIVTASTAPAASGDALPLKVVQTFDDGTATDLPSGAIVTWTDPLTVPVLDPDSTDGGKVPPPGDTPTAIFIDNSRRPERGDDLDGVLFILDAGTRANGTATITATISGAAAGTVTAELPVGLAPTGSAPRGSSLYASACATCHGDAGEGTPANGDGSFTLEGAAYDYPAPGLNTADGNLASDPDWTFPLFAMATRADLDDGAVVLRRPMPDWLSTQLSGHVLSTQDLADIYAFLQSQ
jgi:mono/diheme cytochrome c family protein